MDIFCFQCWLVLKEGKGTEGEGEGRGKEGRNGGREGRKKEGENFGYFDKDMILTLQTKKLICEPIEKALSLSTKHCQPLIS